AKLLDIAAATRREWQDLSRSDAQLIDLAAAMDDARATSSRKAFSGCEERTWSAWKAAVARIPAKKFEGMHDDRQHAVSFVDAAMGPIVGEPRAYLASVALSTCMSVGQESNAKRDMLVRLLGDALRRWPGFRGPRTATQTAILGAGIGFDDRDAKLE